MDHGAFERVVIEDGRQQERRQFRFVLCRLIGLRANAREQRLVAADADQMGDLALRHRELLGMTS